MVESIRCEGWIVDNPCLKITRMTITGPSLGLKSYLCRVIPVCLDFLINSIARVTTAMSLNPTATAGFTILITSTASVMS